ncbi:MAG: hypothetical protein K6A65_02890 [Succinivibrionaceae bacterium]|nr:hypothetical protein [Succinivibrionaceae bacterium]
MWEKARGMSPGAWVRSARGALPLLAIPLALLLGACSQTTSLERCCVQAGQGLGSPCLAGVLADSHARARSDGYHELRVPAACHGVGLEKIPAPVREVAQRLLDAGHEAYIIGGAVRDFAMGMASNDLDIATSATNAQIKEILGDLNVRFHPVEGKEFGKLRYQGEDIDVATFYNIPPELHGLPGIPDFDPAAASSGSALHDSFRRDLTFNALYYDLRTGDILDYHGGLYSILHHEIAPIADPRVYMDAGRLIRALRFKARYGYTFSPELEQYVRQDLRRPLEGMHPGVTCFQLLQIFSRGYARQGVEVLEEYDLLREFFSPLRSLPGQDRINAYALEAAIGMDGLRAAGGKVRQDLMLAAMLWPAVAQRLSTGQSLRRAIDSTFAEAARLLDPRPGDWEAARDLLLLQWRLGKGQGARGASATDLGKALVILGARAELEPRVKALLPGIKRRLAALPGAA